MSMSHSSLAASVISLPSTDTKWLICGRNRNIVAKGIIPMEALLGDKDNTRKVIWQPPHDVKACSDSPDNSREPLPERKRVSLGGVPKIWVQVEPLGLPVTLTSIFSVEASTVSIETEELGQQDLSCHLIRAEAIWKFPVVCLSELIVLNSFKFFFPPHPTPPS